MLDLSLVDLKPGARVLVRYHSLEQPCKFCGRHLSCLDSVDLYPPVEGIVVASSSGEMTTTICCCILQSKPEGGIKVRNGGKEDFFPYTWLQPI